jgi:DNA-binding NarL/FixJ family response regulator
MNLLVIESCGFTRLGIYSLLMKNESIHITDCESISQAMQEILDIQPDIILLNTTQYCYHSEFSCELREFIERVKNIKMYCYGDAQYPVAETPISVTRDIYILNKQLLTHLLKNIVLHPDLYLSTKTPCISRSIFSDQEILVMNYWMSEMPNYRIARKLEISSRTVYVHKRHLAQKIKVRNRLEFCFIYNFIRYLFWPIDPISRAPLSRQAKEEILTLYK